LNKIITGMGCFKNNEGD